MLPASYGFPGIFRVGEVLATPRTLAEAVILASLAAAYATGRGRLAGLLALHGCLIHPIMGLAGLAVLSLVLAGRDRRWLIAPVALLVAALGAGLLGVTVASLFGDRWPSLLIVQLQPRRFLWLTAVMGAAAFGLCAVGLAGRGGDRPTLGLLALGWLFADDLAIAAGAGGMATALHAAPRRRRINPTRRVTLVIGALIGLLVAGRVIFEASAFAWLVAHRGGGARIDLGVIRNFSMVLPPVVLAGLVWTRASRHRVARIVLAAGLGLALVASGDERTETARRIEQRAALPDLAEAVARRPGAVLWLDGDIQTWMLLGRPNWSTVLQGAGLVFSRDLAMVWSERMNRLIAGGLASHNDLAPFHPAGPRRPDEPPAASVAALCAAPDAPAWIVVPLRDGQPLPGNAGFFPLSAPVVTARATAAGVSWRRIVAYGLLPCSP